MKISRGFYRVRFADQNDREIETILIDSDHLLDVYSKAEEYKKIMGYHDFSVSTWRKKADR